MKNKTEDLMEENLVFAEPPRSKKPNLFLPKKAADILNEWYDDKPEEKIIKRVMYPPKKIKPFKRSRPLPGRNDPCPCGSGKKFKHCHELQHRIKNQKIVISNNLKQKNKQYGQ